MDNKKIARELVKVAKELVASEKTSAIAYDIESFSNYGGQITNARMVAKDIRDAVSNYGVEHEISDMIYRAVTKNAKEIDNGEEIELGFNLPIFIRKNRDGVVEIQFQT